jgi:hypothetical protein
VYIEVKQGKKFFFTERTWLFLVTTYLFLYLVLILMSGFERRAAAAIAGAGEAGL